MFKIGEFSKLVRVSARMLRHYEKCGLFYPAEIDRFTGYRQYGAGQIPLLMNIVALRDLGFSIEEIGDILPHFEDPAYLDKALAQKCARVEEGIAAEQIRLRQLEAMRESLTKERVSMQHEVILKELPRVEVLSYRKNIGSYDREGSLWEELGAFLAQNGIDCPEAEESGYSIYHDEDYKETDVDVEIAVPIRKTGQSQGAFSFKALEAVPLAATLRFSGPYEGYGAAMARLAAWLEDKGYEICGLTRGAAIRTAADQSRPENFLTEIQIPVRKR